MVFNEDTNMFNIFESHEGNHEMSGELINLLLYNNHYFLIRNLKAIKKFSFNHNYLCKYCGQVGLSTFQG
jgi:hypothetical protein